MIAGDQIVSLIALVMALVLALANIRGRKLPIGSMATMVLIWGLILVALTLFFARTGGNLSR